MFLSRQLAKFVQDFQFLHEIGIPSLGPIFKFLQRKIGVSVLEEIPSDVIQGMFESLLTFESL